METRRIQNSVGKEAALDPINAAWRTMLLPFKANAAWLSRGLKLHQFLHGASAGWSSPALPPKGASALPNLVSNIALLASCIYCPGCPFRSCQSRQDHQSSQGNHPGAKKINYAQTISTTYVPARSVGCGGEAKPNQSHPLSFPGRLCWWGLRLSRWDLSGTWCKALSVVVAPFLWNSLPLEDGQAPSLLMFRTQVKTDLFRQAFNIKHHPLL